MLKKFEILFFFFSLCSYSTCANANVLDSLLNTLSELSDEATSENLDSKSILCNNIAVQYQNIHERNKARIYFLKSISFTESRIELEQDWNAQNCYDLASLYQNMATFESTTRNEEQAMLYLDKSEVYYKRLKSLLPREEYNAIMVGFYNTNFTMAYHFGDYKKGMTHLLNVEKILLTTGENSIDLAENYRCHAELLSLIKDYDQYEIYAEKAMQVYDNIAADYPKDEPIYVHTFIIAKFRKKKFEELIEFLNQRIGSSPEEAFEIVASGEIVDLSRFVDNIFIRSIALMRLYEQTDNIELIIEADHWQHTAFQMAENYIAKNNLDKIGNIISNPQNKVTGNLICMTYFKEHSRLSSDKILEALRMIDVQQSSRLHLERVSYGVNQQLFQTEKKLKNELNYVNLKLEEMSMRNVKTLNSDSLSDLAFALSSEIRTLNKQTKHDKILAEYEIGQNKFTELLNDFIDQSNKDVVTYFHEEKSDSVYIIGANQEVVYFEAVAVPKNFSALIMESYQLNAHLQSYPTAIARQKELNQTLYSYLIKPISPYLISKDLLLYPNNEISYVSFDALMDETNHYLAESYSIQYTSSLFSIINEKNVDFSTPTFASYYPANYGTDSLAYLYNGEQEVNNIQRVIGGEKFKGNSATKLSFLKVANQKQILHLASHSILDVDHPYESYVLFDKTNDTTENRLFAYEIFSKTLNCDMVTLSSCNSAKGEIEEGIGVVSLANAFYFAGVPSTVSSLWSAQDKSSSKIMVDFYTHLKLGLSKSESLQRAKVHYLNGADKIKRQPFFWANYVVYGSDKPLYEIGESTSWWRYLIGISLAAVLLILGRKLF